MKLLHIGRGDNNDIVVSDPTVSRQHAQLMVDDIGQVTIIDLNSSNGTFVNGQRIKEPRRLDPTDIVKVGEHLLPWRNYLQAGTRTASHPAPVPPVQQAAGHAPAAPMEEPQAPGRSLPWKWIGLGGAALVVVAVLLYIFLGRGSKPSLEGRWHEYENADAWIEFGPDGKYTEGFKNTVTNDSLTWKAMGVDRVLLTKGDLEISRIYKFDGEDLRLTQDGKTTLYERDEED